MKSDGTVKHKIEFKKANRAIDLFQPELPILKFPVSKKYYLRKTMF